MLNVLYRFAARDGKKLSVAQNIACAGVAGGVAGLVGNPAEVVLVRMCADGAKAPAQQFGYAHAFDALARVYSEEGMRAFWKGIAPNIARSALMTAGTMATTLCAPADVLKSRMQSSAGKEGLAQVLSTGLREEGPRFLMRGWTPAWLRLTYVFRSDLGPS
ncbi:hypothetical protein BFJ68_g5057 [Fusarium oxysporum]|uniref:Mitochondrial 2-oxoglutarate/malate carrier protein n=1 Tax=Fusarium oxysporum TaxID=5507 RepID=A0A420RHC7_FUSOX|nr:hypothetical protein BFJ68_g5057 [Fusarium oxysporum]